VTAEIKTATIRFPDSIQSGGLKEIHYPGGELQTRVIDGHQKYLEDAHEIIIEARIQSSDELISLLLLNDAILGLNPQAARKLYMPYLPYARADRRFVPGDCNGLATFGAILNTANFHEVRVLDAHNPSMAAEWINNLVNVVPAGLMREVAAHFRDHHAGSERITILFPDEGAAKRYRFMKDTIGADVLYATKKRNASTGQFEGFEVPSKEELGDRAILIMDDICDGGGTFLGIVGALDIAKVTKIPLGLYTTHGIYSKGTSIFSVVFNTMYSTDSVRVTNVWWNSWDSFAQLTSGTNLVQRPVIHSSAV